MTNYGSVITISEQMLDGGVGMGWKGTLRSINAAGKRAVREADRQNKADLKAQIANEAYDAVYLWQERMDELVSFHKEQLTPVNWSSIASIPEPQKPTAVASNTVRAKLELESFKPKLRHKMFGGTQRKIENLKDQIDKAMVKDRNLHRDKTTKYRNDLAEWEADTSMARKLLDGDATAQKEVIHENQTLTNQPLLGESISFEFSKNHVHVKPVVHDIDVVPDFRRKQLASGKLSETNMPKGERMDVYQDYVASVALRVAGEVFAMLPIPEVQVTCYADMLNKANGHKEDTPILTAQIVRATYDSLNLGAIDPSDALSNFNHDMNFKKSSGFSRIELLQ